MAEGPRVPPLLQIRPIAESEWSSAWAIIEPVFRAGETYAFPPDITPAEAHRVWIEDPAATFVAVNQAGQIVGTYYIKSNQAGPGSHVCNCGYIVSDEARGQGVASVLCEHSQHEALARGFRAMQYNLVVSTNRGAIRLWKKHGFEIAGTLPAAFNHPRQGYVDAYVMYKQLLK